MGTTQSIEQLGLLDLPDDKIYEICEGLDNASLTNLVQSNKKIYNICEVILHKRLEELGLYQGPESTFTLLHGYLNKYSKNFFRRGELITFDKILPIGRVGVSIWRYLQDYAINQSFVLNTDKVDIPDWELENLVPWISPDIKYKKE